MGKVKPQGRVSGFFGSAIEFSFRYYVEQIVKNGGIKVLCVDGICPSTENITNDSYLLSADIYAVYDKNRESENVRKFIYFILSSKV